MREDKYNDPKEDDDKAGERLMYGLFYVIASLLLSLRLNQRGLKDYFEKSLGGYSPESNMPNALATLYSIIISFLLLLAIIAAMFLIYKALSAVAKWRK